MDFFKKLNDGNKKKDDKEKKKFEPPPPSRIGRKKSKKGPQIAAKLPEGLNFVEI